MQFGINLIPKEKIDLPSRNLINKTKKTIFLILFVYTLVVIATFAGNFIIVARANAVKDEIFRTELQIKSLEKKETLVWTINQRVDFINKIISERIDGVYVLNAIDQITQAGNVTYTDFSLNEKKVSLVFNAKDSKSFGDFTEQFKKNMPQFTWVGVSSVVRNKENGYDFSTDLLIK